MYELKTTLSLTLVWIFSYLWISAEVFWTLTLMILIDTFLWYIGAVINKKTTGWFQSLKAEIWIFKKFIVLILPISLALSQKAIGVELDWLITGLCTALVIAELYSIIWNTFFIFTGEKISEDDAMVKVIKWVYKKIEEKLLNIFWNDK